MTEQGDRGPTQNSHLVAPYSLLPDVVLPRVWCPGPCNGRMRPNGDREFPHQFQCDKCDACVDIHPPDQGWEQRKCGGWIKGVRCGQELQYGDVVCQGCEKRAVRQVHARRSGKQYLLELLGRDEVNRQAYDMRCQKERELGAKRTEQRKARKKDAGHVVYYARLGANHIKIGTTADLPRRMVELRVVNASNLLAAEPGGYDLESQRHEQFKKWRYAKRKEDFGEGPDLLEHIKTVRAEHGSPYDVAARTTSSTA